MINLHDSGENALAVEITNHLRNEDRFKRVLGGVDIIRLLFIPTTNTEQNQNLIDIVNRFKVGCSRVPRSLELWEQFWGICQRRSYYTAIALDIKSHGSQGFGSDVQKDGIYSFGAMEAIDETTGKNVSPPDLTVDCLHCTLHCRAEEMSIDD
jgi:hypothetical protein